MADSKRPNIPSWQEPQSENDAAPETSHPQDVDTPDVTLEQARIFLRDETVRSSSTEKKAEFLKNKGFNDTQIQELLEEVEQTTQSPNPLPTTTKSTGGVENALRTSEETKDIETFTPIASSTNDPVPIITYPEFLTTSTKPPPLITPSSLANILAVSGSVWTLLYGTARFVVSPMVDSLNDARADYYGHINEKLEQLVEQLEDVVSEVPYKNGKLVLKSKQDEGAYADDDSICSDPTELFHRDIGTQTSPKMLALDSAGTANQVDKPIDAQARRLAALKASLREMNDMHIRHAEGAADLNSLLREVRDEIDKVGAPPITDFATIHGGMGYGRSSEPDDEVKKTRDAIRSVKGMFLSSRSFPTTTAR
ncbi:peroxisomal membrane anchor protein conserved region-domain-containing protein [Annulohypoxylon maeteangense]|uniref:peroxisomal membrane anchor protein conserved region-domain-containing protein n=1 Tax=Annulohypoxylon maeteangense TaxID=1927788 RepID=UPI002008462D|nr:peroxisomal membrane anchor protein conserved region-domain-containing protein [Annulohypoxylon maeteangense]KAI0884848.1 peroxisomal membrane anchor protein conserved region-domain-containing protein [Annulohypoxylon maeteangense]